MGGDFGIGAMLAHVFTLPRPGERIISLVQVRDHVVMTTDAFVYRVETNDHPSLTFIVRQIGPV
jgi:hypothetical protein